MILTYFPTFRCNLRCSYCDYTDPWYQKTYPELGTKEAIRLLEICRPACQTLAVSGGEPLMRNDIVQIVRAARQLDYKPIVLCTNSLLLQEREEVLDYVDFLQISLDTVDENKQDMIFQRKGCATVVKENICKYSRMQQQKKFKMNVNCVIRQDSLEDGLEVLRFAWSNNVRFTMTPRLTIEKPVESLVQNKEYEDLMSTIMALKRHGQPVMEWCTYAYLFHIQKFLPFKCYPFLTPRVYPSGELPYPCPSLGYSTYNLLGAGSWREVASSIRTDHGPGVHCKKFCFLPCYMEMSILLSNIFYALGELKYLWRLMS